VLFLPENETISELYNIISSTVKLLVFSEVINDNLKIFLEVEDPLLIPLDKEVIVIEGF
jgi:hypothetical protein